MERASWVEVRTGAGERRQFPLETEERVVQLGEIEADCRSDCGHVVDAPHATTYSIAFTDQRQTVVDAVLHTHSTQHHAVIIIIIIINEKIKVA